MKGEEEQEEEEGRMIAWVIDGESKYERVHSAACHFEGCDRRVWCVCVLD